jgi:hypothetical protein
MYVVFANVGDDELSRNQKYFRVFQKVFHAPLDNRYEELRRLGIFVVRQLREIGADESEDFC